LRCRSKVFNNAGLCGFRISVGAIGTAYTGGWGGTALDTACTSALKDQINYLSCIANPAGCTELCAASPSPPPGSRVRGQPWELIEALCC
jgi:hypothetical protein